MSGSEVNKGRVNFDCDKTLQDNSIIVKKTSHDLIQINLGFLQYHHTYNIIISIPKNYFLGHSLKSILKAAEKSVPNVNCKIISIKEKEDFYEVVVEFYANKARLLKEELKFSLDDNVKMKIEFNARVLGPGKGTPLLKEGIKCIKVDNDELSETSDWN